MNKKLVFRILGALASALIIVSVFVPFIDVAGYFTSLWETFEITNSLYLPIMIIVFGAIGVIFFSLNVKTEFAYMSTGAIIFFLVMQTIDILNQGLFNTLGVGFYFLAIGAILTGVMAFLTNLKSNDKKQRETLEETVQQPSMIDQIDKLYNDQAIVQAEITSTQPIQNVIEPIPVQTVEPVAPVVPEIQPVVEQSIPEPIVEPISPVVPEVQQIPEIQPVVEQSIPEPIVEPIAPAVPEVQQIPESQPQINPVIQEFAQSSVNPVVQEFSTGNFDTPVQEVSSSNFQVNPQSAVEQPIQESQPPVNPVIQEFTNSSAAPQSTSNELDIFN